MHKKQLMTLELSFTSANAKKRVKCLNPVQSSVFVPPLEKINVFLVIFCEDKNENVFAKSNNFRK